MKPGRYRQHSTGNEYVVLGMAQHTELYKEWFVIYRAVGDSSGRLWAKPLELFTEPVEEGGVRVPKYLFVGE